MAKKNKDQISRRDALKVLGVATGAAVLANLPEKWNSPKLFSGVLPAHAQTSITCTEWAVFIEILTGYFTLDIIDSPVFDLITGDGGPGSTVAWACQTGCLFLWLDLSEVSSSGSLRIVTVAGEFTVNYNLNDPLRDIVIDMGTGAISILSGGLGGFAGACTFPEVIPLNVPQSDARPRASTWN